MQWLPLLSTVLAQAVPTGIDGLSGAAGWVGTGLLGAVLAWLMFVHLPAKDKQLDALMARHDLLTAGLADKHQAFMRERHDSWTKLDKERTESWAGLDRERRGDFKENIKLVLEHCKKEADAITAASTKSSLEMTQAVVDLREVLEEIRLSPKTPTAPNQHP